VKLRFTKRAVRQIEEIIDAIAQESPQGARRVRERHSRASGFKSNRHDAQFTSPRRGEVDVHRQMRGG
jgi:DNA-binding GntR family transcriptional regulator